MLNLQSVKCPACGANTEIEFGAHMCFCKYCGTQIDISGGSNNITYHKVDEARIREAEIKKEMQLKEYELQLQRDKMSAKLSKYFFVLWIISLIALVVLSIITADNVGFSPYQIVLIIDIVLGMKIIKNIINRYKTNRKN